MFVKTCSWVRFYKFETTFIDDMAQIIDLWISEHGRHISEVQVLFFHQQIRLLQYAWVCCPKMFVNACSWLSKMWSHGLYAPTDFWKQIFHACFVVSCCFFSNCLFFKTSLRSINSMSNSYIQILPDIYKAWSGSKSSERVSAEDTSGQQDDW